MKGRTIVKGNVEAEAVVEKIPLSLAYIDHTGAILDSTHELYGQTIKDKILVVSSLKGSSMQELALAALVQRGIAPRGIITSDADTRLITAALFCEIPLMDTLEKNPLEAITTGDFVRMNADKEIVEIQR
jgi:predicted aconitase with swiveling domain